jgi:hypothetical protein
MQKMISVLQISEKLAWALPSGIRKTLDPVEIDLFQPPPSLQQLEEWRVRRHPSWKNASDRALQLPLPVLNLALASGIIVLDHAINAIEYEAAEQELVPTDFKDHWDRNEITRRYADLLREQERLPVVAEVTALDDYLHSVSLPAKAGDFVGKAAADFLLAFRKHV